jgi:hypothetical protein
LVRVTSPAQRVWSCVCVGCCWGLRRMVLCARVCLYCVPPPTSTVVVRERCLLVLVCSSSCVCNAPRRARVCLLSLYQFTQQLGGGVNFISVRFARGGLQERSHTASGCTECVCVCVCVCVCAEQSCLNRQEGVSRQRGGACCTALSWEGWAGQPCCILRGSWEQL